MARAIRAVIAQCATSPQEGWLHQKAGDFWMGDESKSVPKMAIFGIKWAPYWPEGRVSYNHILIGVK